MKRASISRLKVPAAALTVVMSLFGTSPVLAEDSAKTDEMKVPMRIGYVASPFGHYLAGRHAQFSKEYGLATDLLAVAQRRYRENPALAETLMGLMLAEGRIDEAAAAAPSTLLRAPGNRDAHFARFLKHAKDGKWEKAGRSLTALPKEGPDLILRPMLQAWQAAALGDQDGAIEQAQSLSEFEGFQGLQQLLETHLADFFDSKDDATELYEKLVGDDEAFLNLRATELAGNFYERSDQSARAKKLYQAYNEQEPGEPIVEAGLTRLAAGEIPDKHFFSAQRGLSETLFQVSSALYNSDETDILSLTLANASRYLDPSNPYAQLLVGQMLETDERYNVAATTYESIPQTSAHWNRAQLATARVYVSEEKYDAAKGILNTLAEDERIRYNALVELGDLYRAESDFANAAVTYERALSVATESQAHWRLYYYTGMSHEQSKQWEKAEKAFLTALELEPDQPSVLNYLGYSWADQGKNLDQALDMIQKAVDRRPRDGYIVDSLGWVLYRLGKYVESVPHLERATELRPMDPIINDHLGDAYWQVGRHQEAQFQWRRSLSFDPNDDLKADIKKKLDGDLEALKDVIELEAEGETKVETQEL